MTLLVVYLAGVVVTALAGLALYQWQRWILDEDAPWIIGGAAIGWPVGVAVAAIGLVALLVAVVVDAGRIER